MKVAFFSSKPYDREFFDAANVEFGHDIRYLEPRLTRQTVSLAEGHDAVCIFVNDEVDAGVLQGLSKLGVSAVALRCAGFNNVDLAAAEDLGLKVVRVPAYSPQAIAEHTLALLLCLQRNLHRAYQRVREMNFSLDGLLGREIGDQTIGVVGTGEIGERVACILATFGAEVLAFDPNPNEKCLAAGIGYTNLDDLFARSDVITLHCPLIADTHHLVRAETIAKMQPGAVLINTSRGGLIDTTSLIEGLKSGQIGAVGIDVYEEEENLFFEDLSDEVIQDDQFARLLTFPNVIVTGHQAFFTAKAMRTIAETTLNNLREIESNITCSNTIQPRRSCSGNGTSR